MRGEAPTGRDTHGVHDAREPISSGRLRSSRPGTGNRHSWEAHGSELLFAFSEAATNLVRAVGLKRLAIAAAAIALVVALVAGVRGCMAAGAATPAPDEADQTPVQQQAQRDPIDEDELKTVLGDELAAQLVKAASTSDDVAWIAAHPDAYAGDGDAVQCKRASDGGYETTFDGTDATFLVNEAASLGLSCEALAADADSVRSALEGGAVIICNVGPGDFTDNGHFFVITGIDDEGNLVINDPYSAERSNRAWDVDTVLGQTIGLWAYRLA